MFSIKADIIRLTAGLALFNLFDYWLFVLVGAILCLIACINFAMHLGAPHLIAAVKADFESKN